MPYPYPGLGPRSYSAPYGGIPTVPSPISTAGEAVTGDIGLLGGLYDLSRGVSSAAAEGARTQYAANLPMFTPLTEAGSANIAANLAGVVNPDVINFLGTQAAERGMGFGPDSPGTNAAYLRALGLTSQGRQDLGQQQLTQAIQRTPVGPMFNPASMLINPDDLQAAALYAAQLSAAPDPAAAAAAGEQAVNRGVRAGAGTSPGYIPSGGGQRLGANFNQPGVVVGPSTGTGTTIGGVTYYGGETPGSAAQNWETWARGAGLLPGTGGNQGGMSDEDLYYLTGWNPQDIAAGGITGSTLGGAGTGSEWWQNFGVANDYDPFGIMGPYEGADLTGDLPYFAGGGYEEDIFGDLGG